MRQRGGVMRVMVSQFRLGQFILRMAKQRSTVPTCLTVLLVGFMMVGCREDVPQSELDRFIAQHREIPAAEYEDSLRVIVTGPTPQSTFAHYELGNLFYNAASESALVRGWKEGPAQALIDSAMFHFEKAVAQDTAFVQAYVNLGSLWDDLADQTGVSMEERKLREERLNIAEEMYQKALNINPNDEKALCNMGSLYMKKRVVSQAVDHFNRALEVNPNSALAHYNLAIAFAEEKIYREAIREWEAAVDADPEGDIGERSRENIKIVENLMNSEVPDKLGGEKTASGK